MTRGGALLLVIAVGVLVLLSQGLGANDIVAGDEGYYGIMARNIGSSVEQVISPSLSPLGPAGDKPPFYPLVLYGVLAIGGIDEVSLRLPTVVIIVAACLLLVPLGRALGCTEAGFWASLFFLVSPAAGRFGREVHAEPLVSLLGLAGILAYLTGLRSGRRRWIVAAGVAFGLGFLTKVWLVLPFAATAVGAGLIAGSTQRARSGVVDGFHRSLRPALLVAGVTLAVMSLQVMACLIFRPQDVVHWLEIYFSFSLVRRVSGAAFDPSWRQPWHWYVALLGRSVSLVFPLCVFGLVHLSSTIWRRRVGTPKDSLSRLAFWLIVIWLLPLIPLSIVAVKGGHYVEMFVYPSFLTAGFGMVRLRETIHGTDRPPAGALITAAALSVIWIGGSLLGLPVGTSIRGIAIVVPAVAAIGWVGTLLLAASARRAPRALARIAIPGMIAVVVLVGLGRDVQVVRSRSHVTGYARLAGILAPALDGLPPERECFFAPEWPALAFYTFRNGRYWESPYVARDPEGALAAFRGADPYFFVIDVGDQVLYGGTPDEETRRVLEAEGRRIAIPIDRDSLRVVVNAALAKRIDAVTPSATGSR
ncbi:MAG: ArnT family glycosyltransferase [Candidatus Eisenbacteria bacterium]|nr:glycosyltransferase family 39 protein [Candidatus Eisenbacteria bacterium]